MKLPLYSSRTGSIAPNLVGIQDARFNLPTMLVCPLRTEALRRRFRAVVTIGGQDHIVLCDLARPIHRRVLRPVGELSEADSARVMDAFVSLLAA